jgi:hypothetical protein
MPNEKCCHTDQQYSHTQRRKKQVPIFIFSPAEAEFTLSVTALTAMAISFDVVVYYI